MILKFDANQEFQIAAIESVSDLFEGQPKIESSVSIGLKSSIAAVGNELDLGKEELLRNLQAVQERNSLSRDSDLKIIVVESTNSGFLNYSVEMETGTGKTYVYIRTIYELNKRYGMKKFVIVVPSIAIREGVLKTLTITDKHFRELYGNVPFNYSVYDSGNLSRIRQFSLSEGIEILIMTIDSFNKDTNIINQPTDRLQGETPIKLIQATNPILILDEPQNMETDLSIRALATLHPVLALRYSATHRNPYNLVFRLTPYDAYRQGLVKRIEVAGIEIAGADTAAYIRLDEIKLSRNELTARVTVRRLMKQGDVKEQRTTIRPMDNLKAKTNLTEYADYTVQEINYAEGFVSFSNGKKLYTGQSTGADKKAVFDAQIRYTIEEHFLKDARLRPQGIKVLSLIFIDKVDNYVLEDGIIRKLFAEAFDDISKRFPAWQSKTPKEVCAAYFAERRLKADNTVYVDSTTGESERDKQAYDLIMRDKEKLLSLDEPTCFIFTHSALREGWDNPNVFQICTLNETHSEMKKRQEIGRGIRLSVNEEGERIRDDKINVLTVTANQSYENYVESYQSEVEEAFGREGMSPRPSNAREKGVARLRKEYALRDEFKELWERIKFKTRYAVRIDSQKLVQDVLGELDQAEMVGPMLGISKARLEVGSDDQKFTAQVLSSRKEAYKPAIQEIPNIVETASNMMECTTPPMRITRLTMISIIKQAKKRQLAVENPNEFARVMVHVIKRRLMDQLVSGIQYRKVDDWYRMERLDSEIPSWKEYLIPVTRSVYDNVIFESDVEKKFVEDLEKREDVKLYLKLPSWFTVSTPVGEYNPDWAIVMEPRDEHGVPTGEELLYLVRETKHTTDLSKLRPDEARKVICGQKHFRQALGVDFKVVTDAKDLT